MEPVSAPVADPDPRAVRCIAHGRAIPASPSARVILGRFISDPLRITRSTPRALCRARTPGPCSPRDDSPQDNHPPLDVRLPRIIDLAARRLPRPVCDRGLTAPDLDGQCRRSNDFAWRQEKRGRIAQHRGGRRHDGSFRALSAGRESGRLRTTRGTCFSPNAGPPSRRAESRVCLGRPLATSFAGWFSERTAGHAGAQHVASRAVHRNPGRARDNQPPWPFVGAAASPHQRERHRRRPALLHLPDGAGARPSQSVSFRDSSNWAAVAAPGKTPAFVRRRRTMIAG